MLSLLLVAAVLCSLTAMAAFADETGSAWLDISTEGGVTASVTVDTAVTSGSITVTYDSSKLTYEDITVGEGVAMYAVNPNEPGVVRISWVSDGAITGETVLFDLSFSGKDAGSISVSGTAKAVSGSLMELTKKTAAGTDSGNAPTGDQSNIGWLAVLMVVCAVGIVVVVIIMKKKGDDEE